MKINQQCTFKQYNINNKSFKGGLVSQAYIKFLKEQNTIEAEKILSSVLGYNAAYRGAQNVNPDKVARELANKFNIKTEFENNPLFATFVALAVNIFHRLNLPKPPAILLKNFNNTIYEERIGICAVHAIDSSLSYKYDRSFDVGSAIMNSAKNWGDKSSGMTVQEEMIELFKSKQSSSCHFFAPFIHEFFHNAHLVNLQRRYGKGSKIFAKFQKEFKNQSTIDMIKNETSTYGATQPCEMIAEEMTELAIDSLNPMTLLPNELIFKMKKLEEPLNMNHLIDACWNGDVKQVELFRKKKNSIIQWLKSHSSLN